MGVVILLPQDSLFPRIEHAVPTRWKFVLVPLPAWTLWRREKCPSVWYIFWTKLLQSTPSEHIFLKGPFKGLFSHIYFDLPIALFPSGFTTAILYAFIPFSIPTAWTFTSSLFIRSSSKRPHNIILSMYLFRMILGIISIASLSNIRTTVFSMA